MSVDNHDSHWGFAPVIGLIKALAIKKPDPRDPPFTFDDAESPQDGEGSDKDTSSALGDFERIWKALGKPAQNSLLDTTPGLSPPSPDDDPSQESSDPVLESSPLKGVRWRDGDGITDLEDNAPSQKLSKSASRRALKDRDSERRAQIIREHALMLDSTNHSKENRAHSDTDAPTRIRSNPLKVKRNSSLALLPSSIYVPPSNSPPKPSILKSQSFRPVSDLALWAPSSYSIEPLSIQTSAERKAKLLVKLAQDFPEDARRFSRLGKPKPLKPLESSTPEEIHVFIDCSNIMIGFLDTLKLKRNIPEFTRPRRAPMSFHSLALVLERGRPTRKRILAGSKPLTPAMKEAEECGYETNILDRVLKAREPSTSHRHHHHRRNSTTGNGNGNTTTTPTSGPSSGSDTGGSAVHKRLVEQAVDEILHLKMMESLVDTAVPATIVLATGDAAEAEYSAGFMRMVERALERGWRVELANFSRNCSFAYRRRGFRQKWGDRFRLVELDDYCEELLDA